MQFKGLTGTIYSTGRELGRGGEGCVAELDSHPELVLKYYNEPLPSGKLEKLRYMVTLATPDLQSYAAWPTDVVTDMQGKPQGFTMKKLTQYVPLHMLFSPMDRKKLFPDKGYSFLLHTARNLASVFYRLHAAGLVMGDVNEGNILVNNSGMVALIDCDSFQLKKDSTTYYCEVGVPRYTPPELLQLGSFTQSERTSNTDNFSLAVLLFQLLFLGRHPYAGRNTGTEDIDEETAIRGKQFAYSLRNRSKLLSPPENSWNIHNLSDDLIQLFHEGFENEQRPSPERWMHALEGQLKHIKQCTASRQHNYPSALEECPWCAFRRDRGIVFFLDDTSAHFVNDDGMSTFINGIKTERFSLDPIDIAVIRSKTRAAPARATPSSKANRTLLLVFGLLLVLAGLASDVSPLTATGIGSLLLLLYSRFFNPANKELAWRNDVYDMERRTWEKLQNEYVHIRKKIGQYHRRLEGFEEMLVQYKSIPQMMQQMARKAEEAVFKKQLHYYLSIFPLADAAIPYLGATRKDTLLQYGIVTAADIGKMKNMKIPGIGPVYYEKLLAWERQISSNFVYRYDHIALEAEITAIRRQLQQHKKEWREQILQEYPQLQDHRKQIKKLMDDTLPDLKIAAQRYCQAEADYHALKKR